MYINILGIWFENTENSESCDVFLQKILLLQIIQNNILQYKSETKQKERKKRVIWKIIYYICIFFRC